MDGPGVEREMNRFADLLTTRPQEIWGGVIARAIHGDRVTLSVVELDPNTVIPEHSHDNEQVGMVVVGSLLFRIEDESRALRAGGAWCIPASTPHEVTTGSLGAVVIEVFSPPRTDWHGIEAQEERRPRWPA
jgi:quercetin dioxygenase-like cupin family protein